MPVTEALQLSAKADREVQDDGLETTVAEVDVIYDLTDVNGEATMSRSFAADQSCDGWARKATSSPLYKQGPIVGTVSASENTTFTGVLISDE